MQPHFHASRSLAKGLLKKKEDFRQGHHVSLTKACTRRKNGWHSGTHSPGNIITGSCLFGFSPPCFKGFSTGNPFFLPFKKPMCSWFQLQDTFDSVKYRINGRTVKQKYILLQPCWHLIFQDQKILSDLGPYSSQHC